MAYVLKDEHNLTNWLNSLTRESAVLKVVMLIEAAIAVVLIIAGIIVLIATHSYNLLIFAGVITFFAAGHWYKQYENSRDSQFIKRGREGEIRNSDRLERGLDDDYYILNDINLVFGRVKSQIDHVVVGPNGLFIIETKNWRGKLIGNETDTTWTQRKEDKNGSTVEIQLGNPIVQNLRHVNTAIEVLKSKKIRCDDIFSVVVVSNHDREIKSITPVLAPGEMVEYIKWAKSSLKYTPEEISSIIEALFPECKVARRLK